ncbi:MAG: aminopeptidase, partial [Erysipelotrichaceae bacterium]|nr:aminopeptidase [Erysipelotrichaceae bacterium]
RDDTVYNESFATTVEREGVRRWILAQGSDPMRIEWEDIERHRAQFLQLVTLIAEHTHIGFIYDPVAFSCLFQQFLIFQSIWYLPGKVIYLVDHLAFDLVVLGQGDFSFKHLL